jgi:ATP synthase protein I
VGNIREPEDPLARAVRRQADRRRKAEKESGTLLGQTVYLGTLGLMFVLPVVGGAYLGVWLDDLFAGYSVRWTISLILLGVFVGGVNVYLFIRE